MIPQIPRSGDVRSIGFLYAISRNPMLLFLCAKEVTQLI